jgi:hypothetical protein
MDREPSKEHGVCHAEQCGVCADAEGNRCNCDGRKTGAAADTSQRVAKIRDQVLYSDAAAGPAAFFLSAFEVAESTECCLARRARLKTSREIGFRL